MLKRTYIKISGLIFLALATTLVGLAFFLPLLLDLNSYRDEIISTLRSSLNRPVNFTNAAFVWHIGPSFVLDGVKIGERTGSDNFLTAKKITINLAFLPLFEKKMVLRSLIVDEADIHLNRDRQGKLNIDDLLKPSADKLQVQLKKIQLRKTSIKWRDMAMGGNGFTADARNMTLILENLARGKKGNIKLSFEIPAATGLATQVSISGTLKIPADPAQSLRTELNLDTDIKQADIGRFWGYYGKYIPFPNTGGVLNIVTTFKGTLKEFTAKGRLGLANVVVVWPSIFHHPVNPRMAKLDYELKFTKDVIDMPSLVFSADGFKISGSCRLSDIATSDLHIRARGTTEPFRLEELRQWIPYGIIAKDASEYIEQHIMGGTYRLDTGTLEGRVSQILTMEKGTNYNVLHIKGGVEKGVLSYGKKVPIFSNIKGGLEMLGKDFILSGMSGTFGESPFKMEGRITDYPLDTPCQYPFQMEISPRSQEVAWLARIVGMHKLEYAASSSLLLKGSGFIPSYRLSGEWDLKQASYNFPGAVQKNSGMANHISFSSILTPTETRLSSMTYSMQPLSISANAVLKYGETPNLGFELQTTPFMMGDNLPVLSMLQQYRPKGKVQAHIIGNGNPDDFAGMDYSGKITLSSFSLLPGEKMKPVSAINGSIMFKGNSLETGSLNVRYGSSTLNAKGKVRNFKDPEAELLISSPEFFLKDANVATSQPETNIKNMSASFFINNGNINIRNFSGLLNESNFTISGIWNSGQNPAAELAVNSTLLDIDDLLLLADIGEDGKKQAVSETSKTDIKLKLNVETGHYGNLYFSRLKATAHQENGILYLQNLDTSMYGGRFTAKGRIAPDKLKGNRYDLGINLEKVNAEPLFNALDITREVTGILNLSGDITARGNTFSDVKRTALGNIRLRLEKGTLRRFNMLSKIFSILNFSQLLKFQLPDMAADGMPYKEIKGNIGAKEGTVTIHDLFVNSDAMNISIVGSANIVKEDLNVTIGVQPLQTVDKILNRIPVVGWLLTGKDNDFITAYFEAKGKWSDPQVAAIPVSSMGKGVLNVFRRLFELPVRLFTDTGEVILGQ